MNDKNFSNNLKKNIYVGKKTNEYNYSLNQFNKWIKQTDKIEEKSNPITKDNNNYNLSCYGNWIAVKNYDEKSRYYTKNSNTYNNQQVENIKYSSSKLKIYTIKIIGICNIFSQFIFNLCVN